MIVAGEFRNSEGALRRVTVLMSACAASILSVSVAKGQNLPADVQFVMEERTDDRWLMSRQQPRLTPFRELRQFTRLAPGMSTPTMMTWRATFPAITEVLYSEFTVAGNGRYLRDTTVWRPESAASLARGVDTTRFGEFFDRLPVRSFRMPAARLWELVPAVPATMSRGATWVDTIAHSTRDGEHGQSLSGIRRSRVVGDTNAAGRQLWIISDSAAVTVTERYQEDELSIGARVTIERRASGITRGRYLFDPALRMFITRSDTTALSGSVTLRFPDGRTFSSPARFDRRRSFALHTPAEYAARMVALRNNPEVSTDRAPNSSTPTSALQQRLRSGDTSLRDSLYGLWDASQDPNEREDLYMLLRAATLDTAFRRRLEVRVAESGDSNAILAAILARSATWTPATLRDTLIPSYADPAITLASGRSRDNFYRTVVGLLVNTPPAITADTASWPVTPAIHSYLSGLINSDIDPRLREVALVARFVTQPERWADTILSLEPRISPITREALFLAKGIGSPAPTSAMQPMPASGATWRDWYTWIGRRIPVSQQPRATFTRLLSTLSVGAGSTAIPVGPSHKVAILMYEIAANRSVVAELQSNLAAASEDSARLVFSALLAGVGRMPVTTEQLAAQFRSRDLTQITLARSRVRELFIGEARVSSAGGNAGRPVARSRAPDSTTAVEIVDRLIGIALGARPVWRTIEQTLSSFSDRVATVENPVGRVNTVFVSDSLPPAALALWRGQTTFMTGAEWMALFPNDMRRSYRIQNLAQSGDFLSVRLSWSERLPQSDRGGTQGHGGETRFWLLRVGDEWVVVDWMRGAS